MIMKNIKKKKDAFTIGETYGMFPDEGMRFESSQDTSGNVFAFFANTSNRNQIHIKFDSETVQKNWP